MARTPQKYGTDPNASWACIPPAASRRSPGDAKHRFSRESASRSFSGSILVWRWGTESGDSSALTRDRRPAYKRWRRGGGVRAATLRTAPRPPTLSWCMARTRAGSTTECGYLECARSPLEILGYDQPRDLRVQGAPRARRAVPVQLARVNTGQWLPRGRRSQEHGPRAEAGFPS